MNGTRSDDLEHVMFWLCTGNKEHEIDNFVLFISVKNHLSIVIEYSISRVEET